MLASAWLIINISLSISVLSKLDFSNNFCTAAGVRVDSKLPFSPGHIAGSCNDYLPNDSTFARFLWNVHMLAANGMYVLIDDHSNFDTTIVENYPGWLAVRPHHLWPCCPSTFAFLQHRTALHCCICSTLPAHARQLCTLAKRLQRETALG